LTNGVQGQFYLDSEKASKVFATFNTHNTTFFV
jgi:hypothetical protein